MQASDIMTNYQQKTIDTNGTSPFVSVIIPAFNSEAFIAEAIDSALNQDYRNLEVIVIDDGSTDNTVEIVERYGDKVRLLRQTNKGSAAARNYGIRQANGFYIAFLDADDVWWRNKISYQIAALQRSGYQMAYSNFKFWLPGQNRKFLAAEDVFISNDETYSSGLNVVTGWIYAELLIDCIVWTSTVIVEKAVVEKAGLFNEQLRKGQDYDLWLRLSRHIAMLALDRPTALYRKHGKSITFVLKEINYEHMILDNALTKWGEMGPDLRSPAPGLVRSRLAMSMFRHAHSHYKYGNIEIAVNSFRKSMEYSGIRVKPAILLLLSKIKSYWQKGRLSTLMRGLLNKSI